MYSITKATSLSVFNVKLPSSKPRGDIIATVQGIILWSHQTKAFKLIRQRSEPSQRWQLLPIKLPEIVEIV